MILSFKKKLPSGKPTNFENKIKSGIKIHSIREDKHNRWRPGMKIQMAHGVRTKNYRCFDDTKTCTGIQSIKINYYFNGITPEKMEIIIDGDLFYSQSGYGSYGSDNLELLARNDGFDSTSDFFSWFNADFEGKILHWTDFRY